MLQTLYLDGARGDLAGARPIAVLLDGPALRLRRPETADTLTPLCRLSRVVVKGEVHWRTEALAACMDAGVPVVFLGPSGAPRGACVPLAPPAYRSDLPGLLEAAAARPDFESLLANWFRALEREAIRSLIRRWRLAPGDLRPASVRALCESRCGHTEIAEFAAAFDGLARAFVLEELVRHGIGPHFLSARTGGFDLPGAMAAVLLWSLWSALWRFADYLRRHEAKHREPAVLRRRLVRFFEAEAPMLQKRRHELLRRLILHLAAAGP
jgi:hypothetical protein